MKQKSCKQASYKNERVRRENPNDSHDYLWVISTYAPPARETGSPCARRHRQRDRHVMSIGDESELVVKRASALLRLG